MIEHSQEFCDKMLNSMVSIVGESEFNKSAVESLAESQWFFTYEGENGDFLHSLPACCESDALVGGWMALLDHLKLLGF